MNPRPTCRNVSAAYRLTMIAVLSSVAFLEAAQATEIDLNEAEVPSGELFEVQDIDTPVADGPCTVVRKVGGTPSPDTDPLLGMFAVDPDHCIRRCIDHSERCVAAAPR